MTVRAIALSNLELLVRGALGEQVPPGRREMRSGIGVALIRAPLSLVAHLRHRTHRSDRRQAFSLHGVGLLARIAERQAVAIGHPVDDRASQLVCERK